MKKSKVEMSDLTLGYLINKTTHYIKIAGLQFFKEKNFSVTKEQFVILYILQNENGMSQRQLGKTALKDRPNITRLIDILEQRDLLYRKIDPKDRRVIRVFITDEGKKQVEKILPSIKDVNELAFKGITNEEQETLKTILEKIRSNLEQTFKLQF